MVAAAVIGGAVVGGAATAYSGNKAASAAKSGADRSAAVQQYMYDTSRRDLAPYRDVGTRALYQLSGLYGIDADNTGNLVEMENGIPSPNMGRYSTDPQYRDAWDDIYNQHAQKYGVGYTIESDKGWVERELQSRLGDSAVEGEYIPKSDYSAFYNSPDYQFAYDEGLRATNASLAARGLSNSGRAMKELTRYGQGMASQQLNNYKNQLAALAGIGQTSTTTTAGLGANAAGNIGTAYQRAGDARASGYLAQGNAVNNLVNTGVTAYTLNSLYR